MSNFMKIRPVGAEVFHAEKLPDGLTENMVVIYVLFGRGYVFLMLSMYTYCWSML
jgi:hypothetical protein